MRQIDADALTDFLKCLLPDRGMWEIEGDPAKNAVCETVADAIEMVKNMETIKPRPRGEWQITDAYPHNVHCSVCHKRFAQTHWAVWEDGTLPRNFCPNCGADMRPGPDRFATQNIGPEEISAEDARRILTEWREQNEQ